MKLRLTFRQIKSSSDQLRAVYMQRSGHVRTWKGVFWLPIAVHVLKHVLPLKTDVRAAWTAGSCSPFSTRRGFSSNAWMRCQSAQLGPLIRLPGHTPARTWVQICLSWRDGLFAVRGRRHCSTTGPHFWHFANMCVAADCWCSAAIRATLEDFISSPSSSSLCEPLCSPSAQQQHFTVLAFQSNCCKCELAFAFPASEPCLIVVLVSFTA